MYYSWLLSYGYNLWNSVQFLYFIVTVCQFITDYFSCKGTIYDRSTSCIVRNHFNQKYKVDIRKKKMGEREWRSFIIDMTWKFYIINRLLQTSFIHLLLGYIIKWTPGFPLFQYFDQLWYRDRTLFI